MIHSHICFDDAILIRTEDQRLRPTPHSITTTLHQHHTPPTPHSTNTTLHQQHTPPTTHSTNTTLHQHHTPPTPHSTNTTLHQRHGEHSHQELNITFRQYSAFPSTLSTARRSTHTHHTHPVTLCALFAHPIVSSSCDDGKRKRRTTKRDDCRKGPSVSRSDSCQNVTRSTYC
jgi:hypothetical protein